MPFKSDNARANGSSFKINSQHPYQEKTGALLCADLDNGTGGEEL